MSTVLGIDGPIGGSFSDLYRYNRDGKAHTGYVTRFLAVDPGQANFYRLIIRRAGQKPLVTFGSFKAMFQLWLELGCGEKKSGQPAPVTGFATIVPVKEGKTSELVASINGAHRQNVMNADLAISANVEDVLEAWDWTQRIGWKADVKAA